MDIRRLLGFCAALSVVSPVALAAVPVEKHGSSFRITSYAISVPEYVSVRPRALSAVPTPSSVSSGGLDQRVRFDLRSSYPGLPATLTQSGGYLTFSRDGLVQSLQSQLALMSPTYAYQNIPAIKRLSDSKGWGINDEGYLADLGVGPSGGVSTFSDGYWGGPSAVQWVSLAQLNSLESTGNYVSISGSIVTDVIRLDGIRTIDDEMIPPAPPYSLDTVVPCPSGAATPSCMVAGYNIRPFGLSRFDFQYVFFQTHVERNGAEYSPYRANVSGSRTSTGARNDYRVLYAPTAGEISPGVGSVITDDELSAAVGSDFTPEPSDWSDLVNHIPPSEPIGLTIDPIELFSTPPVISDEVDAVTGTRLITEETSTVSTTIHNNGSDNVRIDTDVTVSERQYQDGELVAGGDKTTSYPGAGTGGAGGGDDGGPGSPGGGGPGGGSSGGTIPDPYGDRFSETFCEYAGIMCDFIDWFQGDPEGLGDEPDLSQILRDPIDFERSHTVQFGSSSCPAPMSLNIAFIGAEVEISYDWWCELAVHARPLIMASAYMMAIFMTLGAVRGK